MNRPMKITNLIHAISRTGHQPELWFNKDDLPGDSQQALIRELEAQDYLVRHVYTQDPVFILTHAEVRARMVGEEARA